MLQAYRSMPSKRLDWCTEAEWISLVRPFFFVSTDSVLASPPLFFYYFFRFLVRMTHRNNRKRAFAYG